MSEKKEGKKDKAGKEKQPHAPLQDIPEIHHRLWGAISSLATFLRLGRHHSKEGFPRIKDFLYDLGGVNPDCPQ